jgi:hypothetical protein
MSSSTPLSLEAALRTHLLLQMYCGEAASSQFVEMPLGLRLVLEEQG